MIDGNKNPKKDVETGIPQSSLVLPILLLIYISRVFDTVITTSLIVTSVSFMDDLEFLANSNSIKKVTIG